MIRTVESRSTAQTSERATKHKTVPPGHQQASSYGPAGRLRAGTFTSVTVDLNAHKTAVRRWGHMAYDARTHSSEKCDLHSRTAVIPRSDGEMQHNAGRRQVHHVRRLNFGGQRHSSFRVHAEPAFSSPVQRVVRFSHQDLTPDGRHRYRAEDADRAPRARLGNPRRRLRSRHYGPDGTQELGHGAVIPADPRNHVTGQVPAALAQLLNSGVFFRYTIRRTQLLPAHPGSAAHAPQTQSGDES